MAISYETDFAEWAFQQAALLKAGRLEDLDIENLTEEIESMGRSEQRALHSRMERLITHLLKWQYQPTHRGNSWKRTVMEQRRSLEKLFRYSPSLRAKLDDGEWLKEVWKDGVFFASTENGLPESHFPAEPVWTAGQILDNDFFPEA